MEFLLVVHPADRDVLIEGVAAGLTNHLITLAPGSYTVALAPPSDFVPAKQKVVVTDTSPLEPAEVVFA
jgi:hypothetical protein